MTGTQNQQPYDWSLLKYAEAVRTGERLSLARKLRPKLLKTNPFSIAALDEVMPHKPHDRTKHAPSGKTKRQRREDFDGRRRKHRKTTPHTAQITGPPAPRRVSTPTEAQVAEIKRLSQELGRKPWIPDRPWQAAAEIDRLRQVRANTRKT